MNLSLAIALAAKGFENKFDKGGEPYIMHCIRVMMKMETEDEKIVAILHDTVEDGVATFEVLRKLGFKNHILNSIYYLTHDKEIHSYSEYIELIGRCSSHIPIKVKMADLEDNSNIMRLKGLREKDHERIKKYHESYTYLKNILKPGS